MTESRRGRRRRRSAGVPLPRLALAIAALASSAAAFRPLPAAGRAGPTVESYGLVAASPRPSFLTTAKPSRIFDHQKHGGIMSHTGSVAIPMQLMAEETSLSGSSSSGPDQSPSANDVGNNLSSTLRPLKTYKTNRDVESAIVRLGRQGRTDEALQLYHAVWLLDALRQRIRTKQQTRQKKGGVVPIQDDAPVKLSPGLEAFASKSKLRPTTRLMNSAIDACARSQPSARQGVAFEIWHLATSPSNLDGSKKPGGALSPNVFTFGALLACCARNGDLDTALGLLEDLEEGKRYPDAAPNEVIYSTVISACERAEEPNVPLALKVLNRAIQRLSTSGGSMGIVGFNAAISTMARAAQWKMALQLLGEMILHSSRQGGRAPSTHSADAVKRTNPDFVALESIRDSATYTPLLRNPIMSNTARNDGFTIPGPDEVTFGTVLAACERAGRWEELLNVARAARGYGARLDGMALTSALHSCQQLGLADEALEYLELMKQLGGDNDGPGARNTLGRQRKGAKQALRGPDAVAYRLAISACARAPGGHRWRDGVRLLDEMRGNADTEADVVAYTAAVAGCSEAGEYAEAMSLIADMRSEGVRPNVVTFSAVINACASASAKLGRRREDGDGGAGPEGVRAPMERALRLLEAMRSPTSSVKPNVVTYNAAIRACAEGLNLKGAFDLLRQLKEDGLEPTIVTYGSLMTACERVGDIEAASKVFRMVKEEEREGGDREGDGRDQLRANEIIYGAAISCCRKAQQPERALLLLRKMISEKLSPNTATFNTVIAALSEGRFDAQAATEQGQLWEKALAVHKVMKSKSAPPGVAPNRQTYNILIRCLAANLQPVYAESMLAEMRKAGFVPDVDLYTMTVRSHERCGSPLKALSLMEAMREDGYDFYEMKILDMAFKNGVRTLNRIGKGFSSSDAIDEDGDIPGGSRSYALSEEIMDFGSL